MALFGTIDTVRAQAPQNPAFATAWAYIQDLLDAKSAVARRVAALVAGVSEKHELAHGVFAIEQAYLTKARPDGFFESHRKYIDIQVIVSGDEIMEVVDRARIDVRVGYDETKDLIMYVDVPDASSLRVKAGEAAIFFPVDVHMPSLRSGATSMLVRKSVLKVPVNG
jgi:YhcH/YjgK/YiaL family protein